RANGGLVFAELTPERMGVRASGEARLEEKIGELIEQGLEVDRIGQLGEVATVRGVFHRLPTRNIELGRAFPQWKPSPPSTPSPPSPPSPPPLRVRSVSERCPLPIS